MRQISQQERRLEKIVSQIRALGEGRSLAAGTVTLRPNQTTTTVTGGIISADSFPVLFPTTANAASASPYISAVANGSFVITHDSNAAVDRTFNWLALGG